ncbi:MAG: TadE/TadG family type IV pilus assembly protein [Bdellovibrionales bacterium]
MERLNMVCFFRCLLCRWFREREGVAAIEAAMVFPLLAVLLVGTYDMGSAILAGQKSIRASQVTADLVARDSQIDNAMINEAITAGELALHPFDTANYGVDIVSIGFDDDADAYIEWRETRNMTPDPNVLNAVASLAEPNGGVIIVNIEYVYDPLFLGFSIGDFTVGIVPMSEVAFSRGRKSAVVERI